MAMVEIDEPELEEVELQPAMVTGTTTQRSNAHREPRTQGNVAVL